MSDTIISLVNKLVHAQKCIAMLKMRERELEFLLRRHLRKEPKNEYETNEYILQLTEKNQKIVLIRKLQENNE